MAKISEFKSHLTQGGARANQFKVELNMPTFVGGAKAASQSLSFLCKAASLPGSMVSDIPVYYRGKAVHLAGEREFQPWSITVINETNFNIRNAFEQWSNIINNYDATMGKASPIDYQVDSTVFQLDRNGNTLKSYKFFDMWPMNISQIELSFENNQQIEEFQVEMQYNYFKPSDV